MSVENVLPSSLLNLLFFFYSLAAFQINYFLSLVFWNFIWCVCMRFFLVFLRLMLFPVHGGCCLFDSGWFAGIMSSNIPVGFLSLSPVFLTSVNISCTFGSSSHLFHVFNFCVPLCWLLAHWALQFTNSLFSYVWSTFKPHPMSFKCHHLYFSFLGAWFGLFQIKLDSVSSGWSHDHR